MSYKKLHITRKLNAGIPKRQRGGGEGGIKTKEGKEA